MKVIVDNSSSIKGFEYSDSQLIIEFTGGSKYLYKGVSMDLVESFMTSDSKGKFFAVYIKDKFVTEKLENTNTNAITNTSTDTNANTNTSTDTNANTNANTNTDVAWPFPTGAKPDNRMSDSALVEFLEWTTEEEDAFLDVLNRPKKV